MTTGIAAPRAAATVRRAGYQAARRRFPPRPAAAAWPATAHGREQVLGQLAGDAAGQQRIAGIEALLGWLEDQGGGTWQERWLASGAEVLGARRGCNCPPSGCTGVPGTRTGGRPCCPGRWSAWSAATFCARPWRGWWPHGMTSAWPRL